MRFASDGISGLPAARVRLSEAIKACTEARPPRQTRLGRASDRYRRAVVFLGEITPFRAGPPLEKGDGTLGRSHRLAKPRKSGTCAKQGGAFAYKAHLLTQ